METINKISLKLSRSKIKKFTFERKHLNSPKLMADYIRQFYKDDIAIYESLFILLLDQSLTVIGYAKISQGGVIGTYADIKIICKYVVDSLAQNVVLCHNHPSGSLNPSNADFDTTRKVKESLKMLDSRLVDHIILTEDSFYSFMDNGNL
jgi:DNA repair protein RadC